MPSRATLRNDAFTAGGANPRRSFDRLVPGLAGWLPDLRLGPPRPGRCRQTVGQILAGGTGRRCRRDPGYLEVPTASVLGSSNGGYVAQ